MSFPLLPPRAQLAAAVAAFPPTPFPATLINTSASRIESYRLCKRRWAFEYIDGYPRAQNAAAAFGEEVHLLREKYLLHGIWPTRATRAGAVALAGLDKIPPPRIADVERKFEFAIGRVLYRGRIDFLLLNQGAIIWGRRGVPLVGDHKTTSRAEFVKTPEHLTGGDPQAAIYGGYALQLTHAREVDLHWSYMIKETRPREKQVRVSMSRAQVEDSLARVVSDAHEMLTLVQIPGIRAVNLEPNTRACEAFGGCPYKSVCPLTAAQRFGAFMNEQSLPPANGASFAPNLNQALPPAFAPGAPTQFGPPGAPMPNAGFTPQFAQQQQFAQQSQFAPGAPTQQFAPAPMPQAQQAAPQTPITARQTDGSTWAMMNGQWVQTGPATQQPPPAQPPTAAAAQSGLQEAQFAASLVVAQQPLPANATPETVRMYSQFLQQPHLAAQLLAASTRVAAPATGIVPGDAPPANTASTTPDDGKKKKDAKAPAVKQEQVTEIAISLARTATALEELVRLVTRTVEAELRTPAPQAQMPNVTGPFVVAPAAPMQQFQLPQTQPGFAPGQMPGLPGMGQGG